MPADIHKIMGIVAGVITLLAIFVYSCSALSGAVKPRGCTWCVWALSGGMIFPSYLASSGSVDAVFVPIDYFFGPLTIAVIVTAKHGIGGWTKPERWCVIGSVFGAMLWLVFDSPLLCFYINLAIDCIGLKPTIDHALSKPEEEDKTAWTLFLIGNGLNLFAIDWGSLTSVIYGISMFAADVLVLALILHPRKKSL